GDIACDHYHRFEEDVALMAQLGIRAYRFSVAWPRIQPDGRGTPNRKGLDHYRRLVAALRDHDISPVVTLYHWDLPQALEDLGGWTSRDTAERFADYSAIVGAALRDDVALWITLCEPWVCAWLGYGEGIHAPGRTDAREALAASHTLLLAHGLAVDALHQATKGPVGITLNFTPTLPASDSPDDVAAAEIAGQHMNRMFLDPVFGHGYPTDLLARYREVSDFGFVRDGDMEMIARPMEFLGVNYYTRQTIAAHSRGELRASAVPGNLRAWSFVPPGVEATAMGWAIDPDGLTDLLLWLHRDYPHIPLYITENGAAFDDYVDPEGGVDDVERIDYLQAHLLAAQRASEAGASLAGYFLWSFLDNFEWAQGYSKRFGLVHVDYPTQRRTPKRSARWYGGVAAAGGLDAG
ncbi:MAG: beta-glucosidase, partial [Actinobacteria bacterium]|nr:beta-glucosidase [Actinomycetota bacterium]